MNTEQKEVSHVRLKHSWACSIVSGGSFKTYLVLVGFLEGGKGGGHC